MNYSLTPIYFRDESFPSIKDAMETTGLSRYHIKKECTYANPNDAQKFIGFGRKSSIDHIPSRDELQSIYNQLLSIAKVAQHYQTSKSKVNAWIDHYDIERISISEAKIIHSDRKSNRPNRVELQRLYDEYLTLPVVAEHLDISLNKLRRWLREDDIVMREPGEIRTVQAQKRFDDVKEISDEELTRLYDEMTIYEMAIHFGIDKQKMSHILKDRGIHRGTNNSRLEQSLYEYCYSLDNSFIQNDYTTIKPYELDIVSHEHKIAIEVCGVYWHSSKFKKSNYHQMKYRMCKDIGYQLITVFETDDMHKVRGLIQKKLNTQNRIYARKCEIRLLNNDEEREFNNKHHLSNHIYSSYAYGLFFENECVQLMSFGKNRFNDDGWEIYRLTNTSHVTVVAGASRLFKHFIREHQPTTVTTFANLRFGNGGVYEQMGFVHVYDTGPNYHYVIDGQLYSRHQFQKHKLKDKLVHFDESLTEYQNMLNNGYDRIYDCGNAKYVWSGTNSVLV